jgi:hypothetical protein
LAGFLPAIGISISFWPADDSGEPYEIDEILLEFFEELHDATGYARPKNLFHFPPDAPRGG